MFIPEIGNLEILYTEGTRCFAKSRRKDIMLDLIADIENALEHNCLRVALGMALTLPDICGQIEYSEVKKVGERYSKWCDKYLKNQGFIITGDSGDKVISGDMCYKLRCAYLHSGNLELNQRNNDDFPEFHLVMCNPEDQGIYCETQFRDLQGKDLIVTVDVRHLTKVICNAAKEYYEHYEKKEEFKDHHIVIEDIEETSKIIKKIGQNTCDVLSSKKDISNPNELTEQAKDILKKLNDNPEKVKQMMYSEDKDKEMNTMSALFELICGGFLKLKM